MVELVSLNMVVDRLVHACWNMLSGNDEITRLNSDLTTTMNLVVVASPVLHVLTYANNPCRFAKLYTICRNMIEQYCYLTNPACLIMLTSTFIVV